MQPEPLRRVGAATHQERSMRLIHIPIAVVAFYLGLSIGIAPAQQSDLQNDKAKPAQAGTEEPSSHAVKSATDIFVNGKLVVPGAPAESQTEPAKFSERNARIDAMPIMAYPLGLSDEQKQRIAASVAKSDAPVSDLSAKPADILPADTPVSELSADVKAAVPMTSDLHFIRTRDKILLVRAPNMVVTGEISAN
jgi:hypothetical protein